MRELIGVWKLYETGKTGSESGRTSTLYGNDRKPGGQKILKRLKAVENVGPKECVITAVLSRSKHMIGISRTSIVWKMCDGPEELGTGKYLERLQGLEST